MSVPPSPMMIVSHAGIGSGPGTAKRARAPVMNAVRMIETTSAIPGSVAGHDPQVSATTPAAPFVHALLLSEGGDDYSGDLPALRGLERLELDPRVTFLVGENGSGKSTLIEAIAVAAKLNVEGGGKLLKFARARHTRSCIGA